MDMCVGETRTLVIPAAEAYGKEGAGKSFYPISNFLKHLLLLNLEKKTSVMNSDRRLTHVNDIIL